MIVYSERTKNQFQFAPQQSRLFDSVIFASGNSKPINNPDFYSGYKRKSRLCGRLW